MIEVKGVSKHYRKCTALDDVTFNIGRGHITGLLGENGAGKSTMLRVLAGTLRSDSGTVRINEATTAERQRRIQTTLLLAGEAGLYEELTAFENILYFARLRALDLRVARQRIRMLSERFDMDGFLDRRVSELSCGMRQKTAIVRALIHDPDIIMLDEPESGLDFVASSTMNEFLRESVKWGRIVIISSHSAGEILDLCDQVVVLKQGRVVTCEDLRTLTRGKSLSEAFATVRSLVTRR
ncbi:ABC transporter related protein [Coriobacterium glomerans PW2]|uniref:ABC transporter related protein n=1 Tax=Coriobacterium glomerans (strain ATCC 49209 / DSM 20642 / JCM 10262 / PW2) TaxID=700015 RepID=F2N8Y2_CORGP|nr:ATP-binding cassette domain-containing protein [Coriobacterium glomerans]AEB07582.1 ABC transporter related protein [Coriobacterium glomerans PW2]